ncbi:MAG TPA: thioredoxin family protein [Gemmatimonadaceae bacterium]|nr:thioredoxin family protein [Gemmatimonadaceae bacterium]
MISVNLRPRFEAAQSFSEYLAATHEYADLWHGVYGIAKVTDAAVARAVALDSPWRLLALTEDWCGDAVNTLPVLARLTERAPNIELRTLSRDANPDLMDAHLTGTARAIPVVMILDGDYDERAWWGSRPRVLQSWVKSPEAQAMAKADRYKEVRRWYARDHGVTAVDEILTLIEQVRVTTGSRE